MINTSLISSGLPQNLWGESILTTNYLLNKLPHKNLKKILYELWNGKSHSYKYLKLWGCLTKVMVLKKASIRPKTMECVFIGYAHNSSAYRFLVQKLK